MEITANVKYLGVNDTKIRLFESLYPSPNGMAYNSYVILDEKVAVLDTVEADFADEWFEKLENALQGKKPDYLIVQHMEPDHSANILRFMERYPEVVVLASRNAFMMMGQFFGTDFPDRRRIVMDKDELKLGKHELVFYSAPMIHWPEVIMTYDKTEQILFTADAFGKFGTIDTKDEWEEEARRYYFGIVGKFGVQVQNLLKKIEELPIEILCPLHGPVLKEDIGHYLGLYQTWSSYEPEDEGVVVAYCSIYGNTKKAVDLLVESLVEKGCPAVSVFNLAECDMTKAVEAAFQYKTLVLATPTYNYDVFPFMKTFIHFLTERNYKKRFVGLMENGCWSPTAASVMREMFANCKDITFAEHVVTIRSALNDMSRESLFALCHEICDRKETLAHHL